MNLLAVLRRQRRSQETLPAAIHIMHDAYSKQNMKLLLKLAEGNIFFSFYAGFGGLTLQYQPYRIIRPSHAMSNDMLTVNLAL
jgi:hypothetical protein